MQKTKRDKKQLVMLLITSFLFVMAAAATMLSTYYMGQIVDRAVEGDLQGVLDMLLTAVGIMVLWFCIQMLSIYSHIRYVSNGTLSLSHGLMRNLLARSLPGFRKNNVSYYLNLLGTDMDIYRLDRLNSMPYLAREGSETLFAALMLLYINPWMCLAGVAMTVIPLIYSNFVSKITQKRKEAFSAASEEYTNTLKETMEGYESIRVENASSRFLSRFDHMAGKRQKAYSASKLVNTVSSRAAYAIGTILQLGSVALGGYLIVEGTLSTGMLIISITYIAAVSDGINNFIESLINIRSTKPVVNKLISEAEAPVPEEIKAAPAAPEGTAVAAPLIEYENVTFGFGERELFHGFSHTFKPGGCYAIVGESGGGKSTLLKLLLKYYDGYEGVIRLAGQDIRNLTENEIYAMVSVVSQTAFLFNTSLYENVTLYGGEPKEDSPEYQALLRDVNLTALAQRVGGAPLGDFGDNIFGGERQRICIARAMRRRPSVMIFDEPTTSLDPENVSIINEFIFRHKDITRIVISHDWSQEFLGRFDGVIRLGE